MLFCLCVLCYTLPISILLRNRYYSTNHSLAFSSSVGSIRPTHKRGFSPLMDSYFKLYYDLSISEGANFCASSESSEYSYSLYLREWWFPIKQSIILSTLRSVWSSTSRVSIWGVLSFQLRISLTFILLVLRSKLKLPYGLLPVPSIAEGSLFSLSNSRPRKVKSAVLSRSLHL